MWGSAIEIASRCCHLSQLFTLQWRVFTAKSQHSHWVIRCLNNVFNNYCIVYKARLWCDVISMYCVLIQNTFAAVKLSGAIICKCINRNIVWLGNGRPVLYSLLIWLDGEWVSSETSRLCARHSAAGQVRAWIFYFEKYLPKLLPYRSSKTTFIARRPDDFFTIVLHWEAAFCIKYR